MENSSEVFEDEYTIIWFEPNSDSAFKENKNINLFFEFQEVVSFAQSLKMSFLLIVPDNFDEKGLFKDLKDDFYGRRLADFEEEAILEGFSVQDDELIKVYVFYTDEDFESEVFVEGEVIHWTIEEAAKDFREELIFWERKRRGLEAIEKKLKGCDVLEGIGGLWEFRDEEEIFRECKGFCIKSLKELVNKRKQEKKKLIYYVNLGECCFQLREDQKALEYYTKACDIVEQVYGETHPNVGSLYEALFKIYRRIGRNEKAIEYGLKTVERKLIYEETTHQRGKIVSLYQNVGNTCYWSGKYEKAIECYLKAVEIKKSGAGRDEFGLGFLYSHIGDVYKHMKDFQKALEYYIKNLEIMMKLRDGEASYWTASSYMRIGLMFKDVGEYQNARRYLEKALVVYRSLLKRDNDSDLNQVRDVENELRDCQKAIESLAYSIKF